jgi:hypothetical protein
LRINRPTSTGWLAIDWLGRPGVHLQSTTNLIGGSWVDHLNTDGKHSISWNSNGEAAYFRLVKP